MKKEDYKEMELEIRKMAQMDDKDQAVEYLKETKFWEYLNKRAKRKVWIFYTCLVTMGGIVLTAAMEEWFFCIVCGLVTLYLSYLFRNWK